MRYETCADCGIEKTGRKRQRPRCRSCVGKNISPETRQKKSLSQKSNTNAAGCKGFTHSPEARRAMSLARGGDGDILNRKYPRLGRWTSLVKERDGYKCAECSFQGTKGDGFMDAHHVIPKAAHPELATVLFNGVTLCKPCHKEIHAA